MQINKAAVKVVGENVCVAAGRESLLKVKKNLSLYKDKLS
jgi:hypothetical protein